MLCFSFYFIHFTALGTTKDIADFTKLVNNSLLNAHTAYFTKCTWSVIGTKLKCGHYFQRHAIIINFLLFLTS